MPQKHIDLNAIEAKIYRSGLTVDESLDLLTALRSSLEKMEDIRSRAQQQLVVLNQQSATSWEMVNTFNRTLIDIVGRAEEVLSILPGGRL